MREQENINLPFAPVNPSHHCDMMHMNKFDPHGEQTHIGERWKNWKRGFEIYLISTNLKEERKK